jgi:hypothetical protein
VLLQALSARMQLRSIGLHDIIYELTLSLKRMKTNYSFLIATGLLLCFACKKELSSLGKSPGQSESVSDSSPIDGKWNLISDSTYVGVGISNNAFNYTGQPGDYFIFNADGAVYTKEGAVLDTLSYRIVSDSTMIIASFGIGINGVPATSQVSSFTADSIIIDAPRLITPAGIFGRKVSLRR